MKKVLLQSINPKQNRLREYRVTVIKTLFGFAVVREWGRIGQRHRSKHQHFTDCTEAEKTVDRILKTRQRHSYKIVQ